MTDAKAMGSDSSRRGVVAFLQRLDIYDVLVIVAFGMFFAQAAQPYSYADLGWHLRTGQLIWETGSIPHSDPYSFTVNGQPWITHEWLSEVIMWPIYATWGLAGLIILCSSTILLGLWFVYRQMRTEGSGRLRAVLLIVLCAFTSMTIWSTLPLVATLCLAPFYAQRLRRWWQGDVRALWCLPPLMMLWVNLHGGYMVGVGIDWNFSCRRFPVWVGGNGATARLPAQPGNRRLPLPPGDTCQSEHLPDPLVSIRHPHQRCDAGVSCTIGPRRISIQPAIGLSG